MAKKGKGKKGGGDDGGKKGKKGRKSGKASKLEDEIKGKGKKGKKGKKGRKSSTKTAPPKPEIETKAIDLTPPVVPKEPAKCNDLIRTEDACRYTEDACCKEAIACRPNQYPGLLDEPEKMAVVGSECGTYESLCKLLRAGFRCADRVFAMTPWGNYVVFRAHNGDNKIYFIYDGCTCNVNRFRYLDLNIGTAGLLYFNEVHKVITYMRESRERRNSLKNIRKSIIDDICREFCEFGGHSDR